MSGDYEDAVARINEFKRNGGAVGQAHAHCKNNRIELERSDSAGCFYCCEIFASDLVEDWIDEGTTAECPKCSIDSVIGDASGFPVTDKAFLKAMNEAWF